MTKSTVKLWHTTIMDSNSSAFMLRRNLRVIVTTDWIVEELLRAIKWLQKKCPLSTSHNWPNKDKPI